MLATLAPLADAWIFPALPEPRALTAAEALAALGAAQRNTPVECVPGIADALVRAERTMAPGDRLVVCGSFHVVGPALEWLDAHE